MSFFDLKARRAAAANGTSKKQDKSDSHTSNQPWVEK
jgi:hypothetical protein